jgi:hypothetical protein
MVVSAAFVFKNNLCTSEKVTNVENKLDHLTGLVYLKR